MTPRRLACGDTEKCQRYAAAARGLFDTRCKLSPQLCVTVFLTAAQVVPAQEHDSPYVGCSRLSAGKEEEKVARKNRRLFFFFLPPLPVKGHKFSNSRRGDVSVCCDMESLNAERIQAAGEKWVCVPAVHHVGETRQSCGDKLSGCGVCLCVCLSSRHLTV